MCKGGTFNNLGWLAQGGKITKEHTPYYLYMQVKYAKEKSNICPGSMQQKSPQG